MITLEFIKDLNDQELDLLGKTMNKMCIDMDCLGHDCTKCPFDKLCSIALKVNSCCDLEQVKRRAREAVKEMEGRCE